MLFYIYEISSKFEYSNFSNFITWRYRSDPTLAVKHFHMLPDLLCFSHLRWNFVYQRPQHLMTRLAKKARVFYIEEPLFDAKEGHYYHIYKEPAADLFVIIPHMVSGIDQEEIIARQREILSSILEFQDIQRYISWYYSPMMYAHSDHLQPVYTVYDCMDELSAFMFAPPALKENERNLLDKADIVFTGGHSLYQAKKNLHPNIHPFPSSIDKDHFHLARKPAKIPQDQYKIPRPRIGFYGVIDERLDIDLLSKLADLRPGWQFILAGPVVKIDPAILPRNPNIHYLGPKQYSELPCYLAGWDIAMMPFAMNDSTRFISPTKTPEYLAGGKPVISSPIADVVTPYADLGLVHIANSPGSFIDAAEQILEGSAYYSDWLEKVDAFLADLSWDRTVGEMETLIVSGIQNKNAKPIKNRKIYV